MGFKGFDKVGNLQYQQKVIHCKSCDNLCDVTEVSTEDGKLYSGDRCERFSGNERVSSARETAFDERERLLMSYKKDIKQPRARVGIPRVGMFYDYFPLWATFFQEMNMQVVPSDKTSKKIVSEGLEKATAEFCFPFKVAFGHLANLNGKTDYVFVPEIMETFGTLYGDEQKTGWDRSSACPYLHAFGTAIARNVSSGKVINPILYLREPEKKVLSALAKSFRDVSLDVNREEFRDALRGGIEAYTDFKRKLRSLGEKFLSDPKRIVIVARPYSAFDEEMNLRLARKISDYGFTPIPQDFLPLPNEDLSKKWINEFSTQGQLALNAANVIRKRGLNAVFIDYFGCGPNSFIKHFFARELGKPFLVLQIDEHTADAGLVTRLEAFLDSVKVGGKNHHER